MAPQAVDDNHEESDNTDEEGEKLGRSKRRKISLSVDRCENRGTE
jgi:hypothetical protein